MRNTLVFVLVVQTWGQVCDDTVLLQFRRPASAICDINDIDSGLCEGQKLRRLLGVHRGLQPLERGAGWGCRGPARMTSAALAISPVPTPHSRE